MVQLNPDLIMIDLQFVFHHLQSPLQYYLLPPPKCFHQYLYCLSLDIYFRYWLYQLSPSVVIVWIFQVSRFCLLIHSYHCSFIFLITPAYDIVVQFLDVCFQDWHWVVSYGYHLNYCHAHQCLSSSMWIAMSSHSSWLFLFLLCLHC